MNITFSKIGKYKCDHNTNAPAISLMGTVVTGKFFNIFEAKLPQELDRIEFKYLLEKLLEEK